MQRFHFGRSGHFSNSELFDAPLGDKGDAEITVFSSWASSLCGNIPTGPNVNGSNDNSKLTDCSNAPVNLSQVHKAIVVNAKHQAKAECQDNN